MKKNINWIIAGIIILNIVAVAISFITGYSMNDLSMFFQEKQTVTFISALQLGLAAFISIIVYSIKRIFSGRRFSFGDPIFIWFISFVVLVFATIDEYFMIHEGIDGDLFTFFLGIKENPHLDGITLGLYGLVAVLLFVKFKKELLKYKKAISFFIGCGIFFLMSITLDLGSVSETQIFLEESAKLIAVSFLLSGFMYILNEVLMEMKNKISA